MSPALEQIAKLIREMRVIRVPAALWAEGLEELKHIPAVDPETGKSIVVSQYFTSHLVDEPNYLFMGVAICREAEDGLALAYPDHPDDGIVIGPATLRWWQVEMTREAPEAKRMQAQQKGQAK